MRKSTGVFLGTLFTAAAAMFVANGYLIGNEQAQSHLQEEWQKRAQDCAAAGEELGRLKEAHANGVSEITKDQLKQAETQVNIDCGL